MDLNSKDVLNKVKDGSIDYYAVLSCSSDSTLEELRRSYKSLILKCHPDKCKDVTKEGYLVLSEVWKTLSDPVLKKEYDERLKLRSTFPSHVIYDVLCFEDLVYDSVSEMYVHDCRCGGVYHVGMADLNKGEIVVPCEDCSMAIFVKKTE